MDCYLATVSLTGPCSKEMQTLAKGTCSSVIHTGLNKKKTFSESDYRLLCSVQLIKGILRDSQKVYSNESS